MTNANGSGPRVIEKGGCTINGQDILPTLVSGLDHGNGTTQDGLHIIDDVRCFSETQFGGYSEGSSSLKASGGSQGGGSETLILTSSEAFARETRKE